MTHLKQSKFAITALALAISPMAAIAQPMLEEVIVTATRRSENLQAVPMSVSAFTEAFFIDAGIDQPIVYFQPPYGTEIVETAAAAVAELDIDHR